MFDFTSKENPILDSMESIYCHSKNSSFSKNTIKNLSSEIKIVSDFLGCTMEQAVLLSIMVQSHLEEKCVSTKAILKYVELKKSSAIFINQELSPLVDKEWITPSKDIRLFPLTEYSINSKLIRSVLNGKLHMNGEVSIKNSSDFLVHFKKKLNDRRFNRISYKNWIQWNYNQVQQYEQIELCSFINGLKMSAEEAVCFLYVCSTFYYGQELFDIDCFISDISPSVEERYNLRNSFRNGTHFLLTAGFVKESVRDDYFGNLSYMITEKAVRSFDKNAVVASNDEQGLCKHVSPRGITERKLIFERHEQNMVNKLHKMLSGEHFKRLTDRLQNLGMKKGISILLYGQPGTGKTETVYQLAKYSNRCIMMADASKIRSKWVGETEKNMKALFTEYRKELKKQTETPILVFNEADSILGKRYVVNDRVDQMENVMQNILLQELENFEGIFIATTNLVDNLDNAFDRRFLYKLRFEKPSTNTVAQIWKSKFPDISMAILKRICSKTSLSGGQIENIRKKVSVDILLDDNVKITESYLLQLAEQEIILEKKNHREKIGFIR